MTLSQITETLDCLGVLIERGIPIPPAEMERLAIEKAKLEAEIEVMDITDLGEGDLAVTLIPQDVT